MPYLGMLWLEQAHNNPVLRVFCQALLDTKALKASHPLDGVGNKGLLYDSCRWRVGDVKLQEIEAASDLEIDGAPIKVTGADKLSGRHVQDS